MTGLRFVPVVRRRLVRGKHRGWEFGQEIDGSNYGQQWQGTRWRRKAAERRARRGARRAQQRYDARHEPAQRVEP